MGLYADWMDDDSSQGSSEDEEEEQAAGECRGAGDRTPPLHRLDEETGGEGQEGQGDGFDGDVYPAPLPEDPTRPPTPTCYWDGNT
jgi:hypothetical protein